MKKVQNGTGTLKDLASPEVKAKTIRPLIAVKEIKEVAETAPREELDKAVAEARKYIADIPGFMSRSVSRIRAIQAASAEERMMRYAELEELIDAVLAHLEISENATPEEKLLNEAARQAYAVALVVTLPPDWQARVEAIKGGAKSRLPGLIQVGILEPLGEGSKNAVVVKAEGEPYKINGSYVFAIKIAELLSKNSAEADKVTRDKNRDIRKIAKELKSQATMSVSELKEQKAGSFCIKVPSIKEDEKFFPGGTLLGESNGQTIRVIRASGAIQRIVNEIAEASINIPVESLSQERLHLDQWIDKNDFRLARILHSILRRGIADEIGKTRHPTTASQDGNGERKEQFFAPETLPLPADDTSAMLPAVLH